MWVTFVMTLLRQWDRITNVVEDLLWENDLTLKEHKDFKHTEELPPEEVIQYLKPTLL